MPDTKLSDLTELATGPADNDEIYIRDVSEPAADESKRITALNLATTHAALTATHGVADLSILDDNDLTAELWARGHPLVFDLSGWGESVSNGAVKITGITFNGIDTNATQNASGIIYAYMQGFNINGAQTEYIDWDKKLRILQCISIHDIGGDHTDSIYRLQLKQAITEGALAAKGLGIRIDGVTAAPTDLFAESYGVSLAATDLGVNMVNRRNMWVEIIHTPATSIVWKVDGVVKRTETDTNKIPSGLSTSPAAMCLSAINGTSAGDGRMYCAGIFMWQEA